jgi:hypothetical protein
MTSALLAAAEAICRNGREPWIALEQHQVHSRIADLVMARIDLEALEQRLDGSWLRALNESELRALRSLRTDRGTSLATLAARIRASQDRARRVVGRLVTDSFVDKTMTGSYARIAPVRPIVDRVVSFEAKRSDARGAFLQARAHGHFADRCFVACDAAFANRFQSDRASYRAEGVGLIALSAHDESFEVLWPAGRSRLWHALGLALSAERTLAQLLGVEAKPLPETRLPGAGALIDHQAGPQLLGRLSSRTRRLLDGLGSPVLGH